jgi:hypothetical protein
MPERIKIIPPKNGKLNEEDRLALASLLIKAGFAVRLSQEKINSRTIYYVEYWEEK